MKSGVLRDGGEELQGHAEARDRENKMIDTYRQGHEVVAEGLDGQQQALPPLLPAAPGLTDLISMGTLAILSNICYRIALG